MVSTRAAAKKIFLRGEVWEANLEPQAHKEEPGKRQRPVLIIQTDKLNTVPHPTLIVIPGTTIIKRDKDYFPFRVALANVPDMPHETDLLIDQVRSVSYKRIVGTEPLATLSTTMLKRVEDALKELVSP